MAFTFKLNDISTTPISNPSFTPNYAYQIKFDCRIKGYLETGNITYRYAPFTNLKKPSLNELSEFTTTSLKFDLSANVELITQTAYDNSTNLIFTDGLNPPRLINSRFSLIGNGRYKIEDRVGTGDTNIYNEERLLDEIKLFKTTSKIPQLEFVKLLDKGNLKVGNYNFYFKYMDADGNLTDIVSESGLISCYIGSSISNTYEDKVDLGLMRGGIENENSLKQVMFNLSNIDESYEYVKVYYSRYTSEDDVQTIPQAFEIKTPYYIAKENQTITVTGFEEVKQIEVSDLSKTYTTIIKAKTADIVSNRLMFGNVSERFIDNYTTFLEQTEKIKLSVGKSPMLDVKTGYANSHNIYNYVGYWNNEIYKFGIVFILDDNTKSPVFPISGMDNLTYDSLSKYSSNPLYDDSGFEMNNIDLRNKNGIVRFNIKDESLYKPTINSSDPKFTTATFNALGIKVNIDKDTLNALKVISKGFFIVRQKRIPTILAQGITIPIADEIDPTQSLSGADKAIKAYGAGNLLGGFPLFWAKNNADGPTGKASAYVESVTDGSGYLTPKGQLVGIKQRLEEKGILSPDVILNPASYSELFSGLDFELKEAPLKLVSDPTFNLDDYRVINYNYKYANDVNFTKKQELIYIAENTVGNRLSTSSTIFRSQVGMPEQFYSYRRSTSFTGRDDSMNKFIMRGHFTPFIAYKTDSYWNHNQLVDIYTPNYNTQSMIDYFKLRKEDTTPYIAITDYYSWDRFEYECKNNRFSNDTRKPTISYSNCEAIYDAQSNPTHYTITCYRGDCYFGEFTTRLWRNFADPSSPTNEKIVNGTQFKNWLDNEDMTKINEVNRSDVNAPKIGFWMTFVTCSNRNFYMRDTDSRNAQEMGVFRLPRSFYPYHRECYHMRNGENKIPESTNYNEGYTKGLSERNNFNLGRAPYFNNDFFNRIVYSNPYVQGDFQNNFRVFEPYAYKEMPTQYGTIQKLITLRNNLLVIFEFGIGLVGINEQTVIGNSSQGPVYIESSKLFSPKPQMISEDYGTSWAQSIYRTPFGVYGVDTNSNKIWKVNNEGQFKLISEFNIQKLLKQVLLQKFDNKEFKIGIQDVRTHYDSEKKNVHFVFYKDDFVLNICYSEAIEAFISRYSFVPALSENINDTWYSMPRNAIRNIINGQTTNVGIWRHRDKLIPNYTNWYGEGSGSFEFEFILNEEVGVQKILNNLKLVTNRTPPEKFVITVEGMSYDTKNDTIGSDFDMNSEWTITKPNSKTSFSLKNEDNREFLKHEFNGLDLAKHGRMRGNMQYKEDVWDIEIKPLSLKKSSKEVEARLRDKYFRIRVVYTGNDYAVITAISSMYTLSYA